MSDNILKKIYIHGINHTLALVKDSHNKIRSFKNMMDQQPSTKKEFVGRFKAIEESMEKTENLLDGIRVGINLDEHKNPKMFKDGMRESEWEEFSKKWL